MLLCQLSSHRVHSHKDLPSGTEFHSEPWPCCPLLTLCQSYFWKTPTRDKTPTFILRSSSVTLSEPSLLIFRSTAIYAFSSSLSLFVLLLSAWYSPPLPLCISRVWEANGPPTLCILGSCRILRAGGGRPTSRPRSAACVDAGGRQRSGINKC